MKKKLAMIIMIAAFVSVALTVTAQKSSQSKWVSKYGYWVIESSVNTPKSSTILFYNNDDTLVYTEKMDGVKLNINRPKTLLKLKQVLEESLIAWNQKQSLEGQQLVKNIFNANQ